MCDQRYNYTQTRQVVYKHTLSHTLYYQAVRKQIIAQASLTACNQS